MPALRAQGKKPGAVEDILVIHLVVIKDSDGSIVNNDPFPLPGEETARSLVISLNDELKDTVVFQRIGKLVETWIGNAGAPEEGALNAVIRIRTYNLSPVGFEGSALTFVDSIARLKAVLGLMQSDFHRQLIQGVNLLKIRPTDSLVIGQNLQVPLGRILPAAGFAGTFTGTDSEPDGEELKG